MIFISLAFGQTSVYTATPWIWGSCIAWLHSTFHCYSLLLPTEEWPGWVDLAGWLCTAMFGWSIQVLTVLGKRTDIIYFIDVISDIAN